MKHSGLGIASFVLGILSLFSVVATFLALSVAFVTTFSSDTWKTMAGNAFDGAFGMLFFMILAGLLALVGLVLGIIGWVQKRKKRGIAITGTIINGLVIVFGILSSFS